MARPPERAGRQASLGPASGGPPSALVSAACRPRAGGSTLVLDAGGQQVIVVLGENSGEASQMWAFIRKVLSGGRATRM